MPSKSAELLDRLGVPAAERTWEHATWSRQVQPEVVVQRLREAGERYKGVTLFPRVEEEGEVKTGRKDKGKKEKKGKKEQRDKKDKKDKRDDKEKKDSRENKD
jgi:hypothetical protein